MSADPTATLERANAASRMGDVEGFLKHCTEDTVWTFVGERVLNGKAAVREWMREAYKTPPEFEVYRMLVDGDFLTAIGEITIRDEHGKPVRHSYCDVWRLRDGLLDQLHAFVVEGSIERTRFS
jgi:uncharacterized protein (TIGR02246 family)